MRNFTMVLTLLLVICQTVGADEFDDLEKPAKRPRRTGWREPASVPRQVTMTNPSVTFESYLQANSNHPALSNRVDNRQTAFQDVTRPAVMTLPTMQENPNEPSVNSASGGTGNSANAPVAMPGATTPSSSGANPPREPSSFQY